jgi:hypothetical protein
MACVNFLETLHRPLFLKVILSNILGLGFRLVVEAVLGELHYPETRHVSGGRKMTKVKQQQTELNSGTLNDRVPGHFKEKALKVDPTGDVHAQAKRDGVGFSNTCKHVVRSGGSAAELLNGGDND